MPILPEWSAMAGGLTSMTCPKVRGSGGRMPSRSVAMVIACSPRSRPLAHRPGCARFRLLSCCGRSGSRTSVSSAMLRPQGLMRHFWCGGGRIRRGFRPPCWWSPHPTIRRCITPRSSQRSGSATRCTGPRRATRANRTYHARGDHARAHCRSRRSRGHP
jgi:hypothetical protein